MSKVRSKDVLNCADCGANDPSWASVNRGILLCSGCCSIHRSLGQHISQIKSLKKSTWHPNQLQMLYGLIAAGANHIWEHCLLDNNPKISKRKPQPKDHLHPNKSDFIYAKHKNFQFILKPEIDKSLSNQELVNELSKQLHSSVRTSNLDTSLRFLVQGADPNYFHDEKGTTPLHVTAKSNQILQAELLLTYGADPNLADAQGNNAIQVARLSGNIDLSNRLNESMYDVIDRLTFYLCGQTPDHKNGQHLLLPEPIFSTNLTAKSKLQMLPNQLFKELILDVCEEIDRRETEAIWLSNIDCLNLGSVPFLPVDSRLSSTRNQGRQKLARFTVAELKKLINDILNDVQRRNSIDKLHVNTQNIDEDHVYDSVASDDYDYITLPSINESVESVEEMQPKELSKVTNSNESVIAILTERLLKADDTINGFKDDIKRLNNIIERLTKENFELKNSLLLLTNKLIENGQQEQLDAQCHQNQNGKTQLMNGSLSANDLKHIAKEKQSHRPMSMYEIRDEMPHSENNRDFLECNSENVKISRNSEIRQLTYFVTKSIQELWSNIQSDSISKKILCVFCSDEIDKAIHDFTRIIPQDTFAIEIENMLSKTVLLKNACIGFQKALLSDSPSLNHHSQQVIVCALEVGKIFKSLITKL